MYAEKRQRDGRPQHQHAAEQPSGNAPRQRIAPE